MIGKAKIPTQTIEIHGAKLAAVRKTAIQFSDLSPFKVSLRAQLTAEEEEEEDQERERAMRGHPILGVFPEKQSPPNPQRTATCSGQGQPGQKPPRRRGCPPPGSKCQGRGSCRLWSTFERKHTSVFSKPPSTGDLPTYPATTRWK